MSENARIKIYKTEYCGYCRMAAQLLDARGIDYEEIMVDDNESRMAMVEKTGWRTVPIITFDDKLIGGYDNLVALDRSGELKERLG
jgi:glutaredoxin